MVWDDQYAQAYETLENLLCKYPILYGPNFTKPFILQTNALGQGVGGRPEPASQPDDERYDLIE